jgi:hypothetical protein
VSVPLHASLVTHAVVFPGLQDNALREHSPQKPVELQDFVPLNPSAVTQGTRLPETQRLEQDETSFTHAP